MISIQQIKAARALLEWRQEDLAKKSGLSLAAINKLERGLVSPRQFTLNILQQLNLQPVYRQKSTAVDGSDAERRGAHQLLRKPRHRVLQSLDSGDMGRCIQRCHLHRKLCQQGECGYGGRINKLF
jgi:transcriptional regulator with XRE-family HTH domain